MSYTSLTKKELAEAIREDKPLGGGPEPRSAPVQAEESAHEEKPKKAPPSRWKKGQSGNPAGRPKGALNRATLVKQAIMAEAEGILLENAPKVIQTVVEQALNGCTQSQKLIWTSIIPSKKSVEVTGKEGEDPTIKIVVENLVTHEVKEGTVEEPVEAEFEEVQNGD